MLIVYTLVFSTLFYTSESIDHKPLSHDGCKIGEVVQNDCNKCTCSHRNIFECSPRRCSKKYSKGGKKIYKSEKDQLKMSKCQPNMIYTQDNIQNSVTCICSSDGSWPHKNCLDVFQSFPERTRTKQECEPNKYVFVNCNVCYCNDKGEIDRDRCTKNICEKGKTRIVRRSGSSSNVYGKCESETWYSLAPCQFCYCANENKLICNTGNTIMKKLQLGTYNLTICGKDLMKEALELAPVYQTILRHGPSNAKTNPTAKTVKPQTTKKTTVTLATIPKKEFDGIFHELNKADGVSQKQDVNGKDQNEYYSDSEEAHENKEKKDNVVSGFTQPPYEEDEDISSKESEERSIIVEAKPVDTPSSTTKYVDIPINLTATNKDNEAEMKVIQDLGDAFKINFPMVLDKVFNMSLRKAMITLNTKSDCLPGSQIAVKCNLCFCMKNGKMLCTNNECKE